MADKEGTSLNDVEGFTSDITAALAKMWITTAEEFIGAAKDDGLQGMADTLGVSTDQADELLLRPELQRPISTTNRDAVPWTWRAR